MNKLLNLFFTLLCGFSLYAQKISHIISYREIKSDAYFRFNYDNDFFASSDKNYTQGYNLEFVAPFLSKNPVNYLFLQPKNKETIYGLSIGHIGFTPDNYVSEEIQYGDRPFATAIMLKSFSIAKDTIRRARLVSALSLGMIGPAAFGGEMQKGIHELTGNKIPYGWKNQIKNDLVLNYLLSYEKQLFRISDFFSLQAQSELNLGTLFTNFSLSSNVVLGIIDHGFSPINPKSKFKIYAFAEPIFRVVGYDASLQGGFLNRESVYTIPASDVNRFVGQFNFGVIVKTKTLYFEYTRTSITPEFETGSIANWGGFKIGFMFYD